MNKKTNKEKIINCNNIREFIKDYKEQKEDVEKWFELKGLYNYCMYANILLKHKEDIYWEKLTHIFRYDKRLHFTLYKYVSLIEEFYRSLLFKLDLYTNEKQILKLSFSKLLELIKEHKEKINSSYLNKEILRSGNDKVVIQIRNDIAHSKILLGSKFQELSLTQALIEFEKWLPNSYVLSFKKSITADASKELNIPKVLKVILK